MLKTLYLHHFRNYTKEKIHFSPGVNWITGKNAQGKTNLLEAIYLLSTGRSYRTPHLSQLIQKGSDFFYLEAEIEKEGVLHSIKLSFGPEGKKVQYNATTYSNFAPLLGLLPQILYAPEDIALVTGAPSFRRKFLNMHLSQISPLYLHHLVRYHKAVRQRNELLRKKTEETIEPWEEMMAHSAHFLMEKRKKMISELKQPLLERMQHLSSQEDDLEIEYESSLLPSSPQDLIEYWKDNPKKELHVGTTLAGPHRDDLQFSIGNLSAKFFASEGQKHSVLAALRLSAWEHLQTETKSPPLMSIDDFGVHLDQTRQANFQEKLGTLGQIFLTSPHISADLFPEKRIIEVACGTVKM